MVKPPLTVLRSVALGLLAVVLLTLPAARPAEAAGIVVNTFIDANPPVTDGGCTLREAIANANANAAVFPDCTAGTGGDTITFSVDVVITLVAPLPDITDPGGLGIDGGGKLVVVKSAGSSLASWKVTSGAALYVVDVTLDRRLSSGSTSAQGMENNGGTLVLNRVTLQHIARPLINRAGGQVIVADSSFIDNYGSGIVNLGTAIVGRTVMYLNQSVADLHCDFCGGGAVFNGPGAQLTMGNSTLSDNQAFGISQGGGLYNSGVATLANVTIVENRSSNGGGGIHNDGTLSVANAILGGNTTNSNTPIPSDCQGTLTAIGPNLLSTLDGCTLTGTAPIVGPSVLGPIAYNGGPTGTHALLNGSPALNAGDPAVCAAYPVNGKDQRGVARPQGPACDLGAYESDLAGTIGGRNLTITTGSIDLTWEGGTLQTGYTLLRVDTSTSAATTVALPAGATSYSDTTTVSGVAYCYVLTPTGPSGALGMSDLLCAATGIAGGSPLPTGFTLALNQTSTATMTLTTGGPEGTYLLMAPLDGAPPSTTAVTPGTFTKPVPTAGACFVVVADGFGGTFGFSNALCAVPGVGTLRVQGAANGLETAAERLAEVGTALTEALAAVTVGLP